MRRGVLEVDLVCTDAETANDNQVLGFGEDAGSKLGFGTDTEDVDITKKEGKFSGRVLEEWCELYRIFSIN